MWCPLVLALVAPAAPAPAQAGKLELTNVRLTVGELGTPRPTNKVLPGDVLFVGYDIDGLTLTPDGQAKYTMAMEVRGAGDKLIFKQDPRDMADFIPLGGRRIPARAFITIGLDQDAGEYVCKVTVTDPVSKATATLSQKFEVQKRAYGIVAVYCSHDFPGGLSAPNAGLVGQVLFAQFTVASFDRDPKTKQPQIELTYQVLDDQGKPTVAQPGKETLDKAEAGKEALAHRAFLFLSRPGKFTLRVTAEDKVGKKTATYDLPFTVGPAN